MLVTFRSEWGNVTMFGDVALTLLKMAGHSGTVPSALLAADIPAALTRLKQGLAAIADETKRPIAPPDAEDADAEPPIALEVRAYPLIELFSAAAREGYDVLWDKGT
jgi:hypothetical protein